MSKRIDFDVGELALEGPELKTGPGLQKETILMRADMLGMAPGSKLAPEGDRKHVFSFRMD